MDTRPGVANTLAATMVAKSDGAPITSGTVNFYVKALSGTNAGKWFQGSDSSWQAAEALAAAGTHSARGHWTAVIAATAWIADVAYRVYADESGGLNVAYGYEVRCQIARSARVTLSVEGLELSVEDD